MRAERGLLICGILLAAVGGMIAAGAFWVVRSGYTVTTASGAMEPAYREGDRVIVEKVSGEAVHRGDVVLYTVPGRYNGQAVLQRVIGLGGDHVVFAGGRLTVNGAELQEPYLKGGDIGTGAASYDVEVPQGRMFPLGDNRADSMDSRFFLSEESGSVPTAAVQGRVILTSAVPMVLGLALVLGVLLAVAGAICVLIGWVLRRRRSATPSAVYL
ncbi:signal peptidase I [Streptomyces sp. NPDC052052]|uniref:signal peptidase I n=1 Tax=Streptomyces sp. NPDC052052 TaxID=3154756 RepID=UPI00343F2A87